MLDWLDVQWINSRQEIKAKGKGMRGKLKTSLVWNFIEYKLVSQENGYFNTAEAKNMFLALKSLGNILL